jgi:uncharacterized delta-60 repeat protein
MKRSKILLVTSMLPLVMAATSLTGCGSPGLLFDDIRKLVIPPGSLDETFGTGGAVTVAFPGESLSSSDVARGVAIQRDGKIVVAGVSDAGSRHFGIARLTAAGALDASFQGDGTIITSVSMWNDEAFAVAIQSDGKIVVAGWASIPVTQYDMAVVRYTSGGELDPTFSGDGIATIDFNSAIDYAYSVALQADGRIIVAGSTDDGSGIDVAMARLTADGQLDTTFDGDGKLSTSIAPYDAEAHSVAIQPDGKIVVSVVLDTSISFRVLRFLPDGSPDASFHEDGIGYPYGPAGAAGYAVAIQPDGKIVSAGWGTEGAQVGDSYVIVARCMADGEPDLSFEGSVAIIMDVDKAYAVAIQGDGRIIIAGSFDNGSDDDFALVRLTTDGKLDETFDNDGILTTAVGPGDEVVHAIAIQGDRKIVVTGYSYDGSRRRVATARYWW